jgi:hypothetical protein
MKKETPIGLFSGILLAVFLFSFAFSFSFSITTDRIFQDETVHFIAKDNKAPTQSDNQLPFEERETDDELQGGISFVALPSEQELIIPIRHQSNGVFKASCTIGIITDLPLYLAKRTIII